MLICRRSGPVGGVGEARRNVEEVAVKGVCVSLSECV